MGDYYDEQTLHKVLRGLVQSGLTKPQALAAITGMQNEGILFRERAPEPTHVALVENRWRDIDNQGNIAKDPTPDPPDDPDEGETGPPEQNLG